MKSFLTFFVSVLLSGATCVRAQDDPLIPGAPGGATPASDKEETGALTDTLPDRVELLALPVEPAAEADLSPGDRAALDGSLFPAELWQLPDISPGEPPDAAAGTPLEMPPEAGPGVSPDGLFGPVPPPPLYDPQHLLTTAQVASLSSLIGRSLNGRGSFLTSVAVLDASQQIPAAFNPAELLQQWHGSAKSLLVLYFYGQPDRTRACFSAECLRQHRSEDLQQIIEFGAREAARMNAPVQQLQRFCYKTAIRLDRLNRQGVVTPTDEPLPAEVATVPAASLWWAYAVGVQAAALAAAAVWWWRRRWPAEARIGDIIRLPDQDIICRLGAPHSGGTGAVIQFGADAQRL